MPPRIAIPMPHSTDLEYAERAIPQYERAVSLAGGEPVRISLDQTSSRSEAGSSSGCDGVLLPGSKADVDPARFKQNAHRTPPPPIRAEMKSTTCCWTTPTQNASPYSESATVSRA